MNPVDASFCLVNHKAQSLANSQVLKDQTSSNHSISLSQYELYTNKHHRMSSHVVVIDSTARRAVIKTTPAKYLVDVLQEACTKLGLDASQYGLRYVQ